MPPSGVSESTVESVALDWLASLGWTVLHGPDIAPDTPAAERVDYSEVMLNNPLRSTLVQLDPNRPDNALDDALGRLTRPPGATLEARNRDVHRMVVAGLDDQLFTTFSRCADLLELPPVQAQSRADLRAKLAVESGGVVFTTIQKFFPEEKGDRHPLLSSRRNIVVIADEAHRSQYDFLNGYAGHMRDALPNASFIGFTGTPTELADASTRAVFGDHIRIYDIQRAVADGATVPIYYESRLAKLALDETARPAIDAGFEEVTAGEEVDRREKLKDEMSATQGDCRRREARGTGRPRHPRALRASPGGDGRQGDGGLHEPADLHRPLPRAGPPAPGWRDDYDSRGGLKPALEQAEIVSVGWAT